MWHSVKREQHGSVNPLVTEATTVTSYWVRWRLKSPATPLFTHPFIQAKLKENIKAPRPWPLCGEFTGDWWIPHTKSQGGGKCFHLMTSSCDKCMIQVSLTHGGGENGHHLAEDIFKCTPSYEHRRITIVQNNDKPSLVHIMAWRPYGAKSLFQTMMVWFTDTFMRHLTYMN